MKDRFASQPRKGKRDEIQDKVVVRDFSRKIRGHSSPYFL
jgi:hypothetical protein